MPLYSPKLKEGDKFLVASSTEKKNGVLITPKVLHGKNWDNTTEAPFYLSFKDFDDLMKGEGIRTRNGGNTYKILTQLPPRGEVSAPADKVVSAIKSVTKKTAELADELDN